MRCFKAFFIALVVCLPAASSATDYGTKKNDAPPGCDQQGNNPVQCPNGLSLDFNDTISNTKVSTIIVTGNADLQNAVISGGITIIVNNGNLNASNNFRTDGTLDVSGTITFGGNNTVGGNISAGTINASGGSNHDYQGDVAVANSFTGGYDTSIAGNLSGGDILTESLTSIGGNLSGDNVTLRSQATIGGDVTAATLSTDSSTEIGGNVQANSVTIGSGSTVEGSISGSNFVRLEPSSSSFFGDVSSNGDIFIGSSNTVNGDISGVNITTDSPVTLTGDIDASGDFDLASGSQVTGNVNADNVLIRASNSEVDGTVIASGDIVIGSGSGIQGTASGNSIEMQDSNAYITDNAFADTVIDIGWGGSIGGDATAPTIINDSGDENAVAGGRYCDDSSSNVDPSDAFECQSGTGPPDPGSTENGGNNNDYTQSCEQLAELSQYGIVGLSRFDSGSNSSINGNNIEDEEGNTPTPQGTIDTVDLPYPPLDPPSFPSFSGTTDVTNGTNVAPGEYDLIRISGNGAETTFAGGTYYIEELRFSNQNNSATLAPGTYYIGEINLGNNSSIFISPQGLVEIYVRDGVNGGNDISFNNNGRTQDLVVYLYDNADFVIGNYCNSGNNCPEFTFNGSIYSPYESVDIEFGQNTNYKGSALTQGEITFGSNTEITYSEQDQRDTLEAQGCDPAILDDSIDHYRLQFPREQISCLAAPVTLQACADASCSSQVSTSASVTVQSSAGASQWYSPDSESTANGNNIDFAFSDGEANAQLSWASSGITTLSISSASPSANNALQCVDLSGSAISNCQIDFKRAGLIITDTDGQSAIPPAFAGEDFDTVLRAVETNTQTGACQGRVQGTRTVQLAVETINPGTPVTNEVYSVNGTSIDLYAAGNGSASTGVSVTFDNQGYATLTNQYSDVGRVRMLAELSAGPGNSNGNPAFTLTGSSINNYVIKPYTLAFTALNDNGSVHNATLATGAGFKAAGDNFTGQIQSLNKQGNITPNFGNEGATAQANYVATTHPSPAAPNSDATQLVGEDSFAFSSAATLQTTTLSWREAGTIQISAQLVDSGGALNNYLGAGDAFERPPFQVGRFFPDRFELDSSSLTNTCSTFSYMGQPEIGVSYSVSAVNTLGAVTQNYANSGGIVYASGNTAVLNTVATNTAPADTAADNFATRWQLTESQDWQLGVLTMNATDGVFNKRSDQVPDGPFSNFSIGLQVTSEIDNRSFVPSAFSLTTQQGDAVPLSDTLELRYGRTQLANISGPQGEDLGIIMQNQYFTDSGLFVTNSDDNCFNYNVNNFDAGAESIVANGTAPFFENGRLLPNAALFEAPVNPELGIFPFSYDTPTWLEFDWDGDGTIENPAANANFGYYRGNDRVIYWLERWR